MSQSPNIFSDIVIGRATPAPTPQANGDGMFGYLPDDSIQPYWRPLQQPIITSWLLSSAIAETGQAITPDVAMAVAAVWACVNTIATSLATIPLRVIDADDSTPVKGHPLNRIFNRSMNDEMMSASGREALMVNALLWGNAFAFVERDELMRPAALWPLRSASTTPSRYPGSDLFYRTITGGASYSFTPDQIVHIPDMSYDGIVGLARGKYAANAIGLALAMDKFCSKFFGNGANLGGVLKLPAGMKPEQVKAFKESWKRENVGGDNAFKTALFTDGMDFVKTATDPRNSQMIDVKLAQVREVARIFRVPLHKIGDLERATFSNIEQQNMEFVQDGLRPWATKWEQESERKLLLEREQDKYLLRHDFDELLRGDTAARYASYNLALHSGWMTRNEVRAKEGLAPIDGGDVPLQPLNMGNPGGNPANNPPPAPAPAEPDKKDEDEEEEDETE